MTNPLRDGYSAVPLGRREPQPGETITIPIKTMDGKDIGRTLVFTRTNRPYVDDLCDAYNANRTRRDVEWFVNTNGEIKLRHARDESVSWQEWKPEPGEVEAINQVAARAIAAGVDMDRWKAFVQDGVITREVRKVMQSG